MNSLDTVPDSLFYQYWGKSSRKLFIDDKPDFHLLPYHCLDVAAVAQVWFENDPQLCEKLETGESYGSLHCPEGH
jgi:CRISPR-associated endonuclease/helicase Cas3